MKARELVVSMVSIMVCFLGTSAFSVANASVTNPSVTNSSATNSNASGNTNTSSSIQEFKLSPAINFWGLTGDNTVGEGQVRFPLYGNSTRALYILGEGDVVANNDGWLAGGGFGYRQVVNNKRIFGGYVLGDYANTNNNNGFWVLNPGLEMLGKVWDFDVNGYFPISDKERTREPLWADQLLDDPNVDARSGIRFTNHDEYAHKFRIFEEMGDGFSFDIGRVVPHIDKAKIYVGAYYFHPNDDDIKGANAKITYDLNKYVSLEAKDYYDNANHNQFLIGFKLTLGGYSKEAKQNYGISARLMDPIENDFAQFSSNTGSFVRTKYVDQGEYYEHDNLWFFNSDPAQSSSSTSDPVAGDAPPIGDGTYENPYVGFNEANFSNINPHVGTMDASPMLYFAPGNYSFATFTDSLGNPNRFDLPAGWGMYGRTADYIDSAMANFSGGLNLNYLNETQTAPTTLDSIEINTTQSDSLLAAVYVNGASNVILRNVNLNADLNADNAYGIYVDNASNITFADGTSTVSATSENIGPSLMATNAYGIYTDHASNVTFADGTSTVSATNKNTNSDVNAYGIYADNASNITFAGGTSNVSATMAYTSVGICIDNGTTLNFNNGTNTITGTGITGPGSTAGNGYGILAINSTGTTIQATAVNFNGGANQVMGNGIGGAEGSGNGYGIFGFGIEGAVEVNFNGGTNNILGNGEVSNSSTKGDDIGFGSGVGISGDANTTITFNGGVNNIYAAGVGGSTYGSSQEYGIFVGYGSGVILNGGTNSINAQGTGGWQDGVYGIGAEASTIDFEGGTNTITVVANGDYNAAGIEIDDSTLTFNGGINTINAQSNGDFSTVYGIAINPDLNSDETNSVVFSGGTNNINAVTYGDLSNTYGIYGGNDYGSSSITFSGGTSNISAQNIGTYNNAFGVYLIASSIEFDGGANSINAQSDGLRSIAYGIYGDASVTAPTSITFAGGTNNITATATGTDTTAYGIYTLGSNTAMYFNYDPTLMPNVVNITANGDSAQYGIYADSGSEMYDDGGYGSYMIQSEIETYVNFTTPATTNGEEAVYVDQSWTQDWP